MSLNNNKLNIKKRYKQNNRNNSNPDIETVTSFKLKRKIIRDKDITRFSMVMETDQLNEIRLIGISMGITEDELMRGLIASWLAGNDRVSPIQYHVPVLNM